MISFLLTGYLGICCLNFMFLNFQKLLLLLYLMVIRRHTLDHFSLLKFVEACLMSFFFFFHLFIYLHGGSVVKNPPSSAGDMV